MTGYTSTDLNLLVDIPIFSVVFSEEEEEVVKAMATAGALMVAAATAANESAVLFTAEEGAFVEVEFGGGLEVVDTVADVFVVFVDVVAVFEIIGTLFLL